MTQPVEVEQIRHSTSTFQGTQIVAAVFVCRAHFFNLLLTLTLPRFLHFVAKTVIGFQQLAKWET